MNNDFRKMVTEISETLSIMESLDQTHKIQSFIPSDEYLKQSNDYDVKHNITDHKFYTLDDGNAGYMHTYKRNGSYEIHHQVYDETNKMISGDMIGNKPNPKFVGTMYKVAQKILSTGNSVRIVGNHTNGMFDHYNRLATILAKRHNKVLIGPAKYSLDEPGSKDFQEITITNINKEHFERPIYESIRDSRTRKNNYGLGNTQSWLSEKKHCAEETDILFGILD